MGCDDSFTPASTDLFWENEKKCGPALEEPHFEIVGAAKVTKVNEAIKAAGIEHQVTEVTLYADGHYFITITGK